MKPKHRFRPRKHDQAPARPGKPEDARRDRPPGKSYDKPHGKPHGKSHGKPYDKPHGQRPREDEGLPGARAHVREGAVLIWGLHAAREAWLNPKRRITRAWLTEAGAATFEATLTEAREALLKRPDAKRTERQGLDRLTPPGSVHQGILLEAAPLHEPSLHDVISVNPPPDLILLLDQVNDPHNVGAILRSAAAFGAGAVVMTERNAPGVTGVMAKAASGALEHVPQVHVVNLARALDELREAGYWCIGLAEEGEKELGQIDLTGRTALALGAEGEGLRQLTRKKCDELAHLPTKGPIGSLNVSNAAAAALYEVRRQKK